MRSKEERAQGLKRTRAWRTKYPEYAHTYYVANKKKWIGVSRAVHLRRYGLTGEQYDTLAKTQGGRCAICRKRETQVRHGKRIRLAVDHDHATGVIRGLLCSRCNRRLGSWESFRQQAEAYLQEEQ